MAEFDTDIALLVGEEPKLDSVLKNLIALMSAKSSLQLENFEVDVIQPMELLGCARLVSKALNGVDLAADVVEWGASHPQGEDQTGIDRMDELQHYKVARALCQKASSAGGKITKLFGKSFLLWSGAWKKIREEAVRNATIETNMDNLNSFLDCIERVIDTPKGEQTNLKSEKSEKSETPSDTTANTNTNASVTEGTLKEKLAPETDDDLIWAKDFNSALTARRAERQKKVEVAKDWVAPTPEEEEGGGGGGGEKVEVDTRVEELPDGAN